MSSEIPAGSSSEQDTRSEVEVLEEGTETSTEEEAPPEEKSEEEGEESEEEEEETSTEEEEEEEKVEDEVEEEFEEPTRLSWRLVKEKYPELAKNKDFRELYFSNSAYREVFPTVGDAKEAYNKAEQLDTVDSALVSGNIDAIFETLNPEVLDKISSKILPALYKHNKAAFSKAARPLVVDTLRIVMEKADRDNDDNLRKSVRNISFALTGKRELPDREIAAAESSEIAAERNRLQEERNNLYKTQESNFLSSCNRSVMKKLESLITDDLDPKGELNEFTRRAIIERTLSDTYNSLVGDEGLRNKLQQTHKLAARAGFPDEYRTRIISASLERAKKLIPMFREKYRKAALGKQSVRAGNKEKIVPKNETVTSGGNSGSSRGKIDMRRTSAEDFLNDKNVVYKK